MMNKISFTWTVLILLTMVMALLTGSRYALGFILGISAIKFLLVAFQFMELKKAHLFWKASLILIISAISGMMLLLLHDLPIPTF